MTINKTAAALIAEIRRDKLKAQEDGCKETGNPHFAPHDGWCGSCGGDVFAFKTVEQSRSLITGCPHCNRSYCE